VPEQPSLGIVLGSRGDYDWLVSEHTLDDLLRLCPEIVLGKYLAVTSFDSGSLSLSSEEEASGWQMRKGIAYSPKVAAIESLPHDLFDEWYIFSQPPDLGELGDPKTNIFEDPFREGHVRAFVNFGGFAFHRQEMQTMTSMFWEQFGLIRPESYIGDGDFLNVATRDKRLFDLVRDALTKHPV